MTIGSDLTDVVILASRYRVLGAIGLYGSLVKDDPTPCLGMTALLDSLVEMLPPASKHRLTNAGPNSATGKLIIRIIEHPDQTHEALHDWWGPGWVEEDFIELFAAMGAMFRVGEVRYAKATQN